MAEQISGSYLGQYAPPSTHTISSNCWRGRECAAQRTDSTNQIHYSRNGCSEFCYILDIDIDTYKRTCYNGVCKGKCFLKSYSSREIVRLITNDGWRLVRIEGSHHMFRHDVKKGTVSVPHPKKDLPVKTALSILKQAEIDLEIR